MMSMKKRQEKVMQYRPQISPNSFIDMIDQSYSDPITGNLPRKMDEERLSYQNGRNTIKFMEFLKKKTIEEFNLTNNEDNGWKNKKELGRGESQKQGRLDFLEEKSPLEPRPFYTTLYSADNVDKPAESKHEGFMTAKYLLERNQKKKGGFNTQTGGNQMNTQSAFNRDEGQYYAFNEQIQR